jgi:homoprotocatechuate degradation regulator HpaR
MAMRQFSESLPIMLYRALDAIMPRFRRIFSDFGLTEQQWRVLRVLWEHDEIPLRKLAALALIPAPSLVGIVDRLQKTGLVDRRRSDSDRRNVFVLATQKGQDLEQQIMPRVQNTYLELKNSMDAALWHGMLNGLHELSFPGSSVDESIDVLPGPLAEVPASKPAENPNEITMMTQRNDL